MIKAAGWYILLVVASLSFAIYNSVGLQQAIGNAATTLIRPIVIPLIELINVPAFVYVAASLILIAGLVSCAGYSLRSARPRLRQLKAIRVAVGNLPIPGSLEGREGWPAASNRLGQILIDNGTFIFAWSEFQAESMRLSGIPNAPFSNYIATEPDAVKSNSVLMRSLPGYFTSLGLIMTFIGLVVALYFAAKGFRSGNIDEARAAIVQLLNAASFKFLTSVSALISAFGISIFLRYNLSLIAQETVKTAERIEKFLTAWRDKIGPGQVPRTGLSDDVLRRIEALSQNVHNLTQVIQDVKLLIERNPKEIADAIRS